MFWVGLLVGLVVGAIVGAVALALCVVSERSDSRQGG